jgi:hypothetical protein
MPARRLRPKTPPLDDLADRLYDVIATNIKTGKHRVIASGESEKNAEAIVNIAVMRRGVDEEFFSARPQTKLHDVVPNESQQHTVCRPKAKRHRVVR